MLNFTIFDYIEGVRYDFTTLSEYHKFRGALIEDYKKQYGEKVKIVERIGEHGDISSISLK